VNKLTTLSRYTASDVEQLLIANAAD